MLVRIVQGLRIRELTDIASRIFDPPDDHTIQRNAKAAGPPGRRSKDHTFGFDKVFDENASQGDVYEATTRNLLDSVLDGYNATVFAYGATGCGKTHTITGTIQQPGVIFLTMQELFDRISERSEEKVTEVSLSYLEIYNETIRDLLVPGGSKGGLMLREDANQAVSVAGLTSHRPQNVQEVMEMIVRGNEYRTMSPTEANATSSRSHAVLQINVSQKDRNADVNEPHTMATLSIIDLAGSERASATKNRGERLMEGANINKSLLALGSCINALCDPRKKNHVPYRNSKLTRLLKFSLGGNCKTVMIVCVSPSSQHFDETQNTLRYANRAKNIQTKVTRNVYNVNRHVKDFLVKIDEQMVLINELKAQQKDSENVAFAKFKKQTDKREMAVREGISKIRNAYDHCEKERLEKIGHMKKLRQIERRIAMISSWVAAFDSASDNEEAEITLEKFSAMRKTAQGILLELESSRHHYHQRLNKNNWSRPVDGALQNGLTRLEEINIQADRHDSDSLIREAELLKANADREAMLAVAEDDKGCDPGTVQVLLKAHFETMSVVRNLLSMSEEDAVQSAKDILSRILNSCTSVVSHIIKPDGSLAPTEVFPPTRSGTPKRKKPVPLMPGGTPLKAPLPPQFANAPQLNSSPFKASPKRRKMTAKKGVSFTPKKKSPIKGLKRGVRWRDDTEEGTLAEFEKTPKRVDSSPEGQPPESTTSTAAPNPESATALPNLEDSSPILPPPVARSEIKPQSNRFRTGFLAKKSDGSPLPPSLTAFSSDSDHSPLREVEPSKAGNRSSLQHVQTADSETASNDSAHNSGSDEEGRWKTSKTDAMHIRTAVKRASSIAPSNGYPMNRQRRRSPTGTSAGSPPNENMFTASHARRMVKSDKENDLKASILSPRTAPVVKVASQRRTTFGEGRPRESGLVGKEAVRLSTAMVGTGGTSRGSLMPGGKGVWR